MKRWWRAVAAGAAVLALVACAGPRVRPVAPSAAMLAAQTARELALAAHAGWTLQGRIGVSDGRDGGSGSLEWTQDGSAFRFSVHAPVTGKTWILAGGAQHATLEGLGAQPLEGADAGSLLEHELGWRVPIEQLAYWVRGLRAPGVADIQFRDDGLPAAIEQSGWTVEYLDYDDRQPPLPRKVFAQRGSDKVRLAIREWSWR